MNSGLRSVRRRWVLLALTLAVGLLTASAGRAATVLEKRLVFDIQAMDRVVETTVLKVRLDDIGDVEAWSQYAVALDENRELRSVTAAVISPQGLRKPIGRKQQDKVEYSGEGIAYGSQHYHTLDFPGLQVGSRIEIHVQVEEAPYYPADQRVLWGGDDVDSLEVIVKSALPGFRWRLDGPTDGLVERSGANEVQLSGQQLVGLAPEPLAAGGAASYPTLRWAWGEAESWSDIAGWYGDLLSRLPRDDAAVKALAAELTAGQETPRQQLEALVAYVRQKVRYVAVLVGIGGYLPSASAETLERKWGDCKGKTLLLIDLLRARGIEAYPALALLDDVRQVEPGFPSPAQFNHLIVAVPQDGIKVSEEDPVSEGFLFIDPTQTRGSARYLQTAVQDQHALVVLEQGGRLVATPRRPEYESLYLAFDMEVDATGNAKGRGGLLLRGSSAAGFLDRMENESPERIGESALNIFEGLLPNARFQSVGWEAMDDEVPSARIALDIEIDHLLAGRGTSPSLQLASLKAMPSPSRLDGIETTLHYGIHQFRTVWTLKMPPEVCLPSAGEQAEENALGTFRQIIRHGDGHSVQVDRFAEMRQNFVDAEHLEALKSLALAEHRAQRRRIRLKCEADTASQQESPETPP